VDVKMILVVPTINIDVFPTTDLDLRLSLIASSVL